MFIIHGPLQRIDILENDFEDYEIVTSQNAIWIIEFKGEVAGCMRQAFHNNFAEKIDEISVLVLSKYGDVGYISNMIDNGITKYLLDESNRNICGVKLILNKKEFE